MSTRPQLEAVPGGRDDDVASPCINVCRMDPATGLCAGCLRSLDEIACWSGYTREEKLAVQARLDARRGASR